MIITQYQWSVNIFITFIDIVYAISNCTCKLLFHRKWCNCLFVNLKDSDNYEEIKIKINKFEKDKILTSFAFSCTNTWQLQPVKRKRSQPQWLSFQQLGDPSMNLCSRFGWHLYVNNDQWRHRIPTHFEMYDLVLHGD